PWCYTDVQSQIFADAVEWIVDHEKSKSIYWISGARGVGKTTIAREISRTCVGRSEEYYYPTYALAATSIYLHNMTDDQTDDLSLLINTIAYQLSVSPIIGPLLRKEINSIVRERRDIVHAAPEELFQKLIVEPCAQLPAERWRRLPRLIVIDGLDRYNNESQKRLLDIICQSKNTAAHGLPPFPLEFLICSRSSEPCNSIFKHPDFKSILEYRDWGESLEFGDD
ncbi:hypothetical protein C8R42DRAFT_545418, partial [Lentinula raphanica]